MLKMTDYNDKQFISRNNLYDAGLSPYKIKRLVADGKLIPVNRNYFENPCYSGDINEFSSVSAYAPKGVVCLTSAAIHHGLSSARPLQIDVALPRRTRIPKSPEWPEMKFYLFTDERYSTGIEQIKEGNGLIMIYDREKTVCDMIFYRNKLGFEPSIEVLKNYINNPSRNINKLMSYAEKLRCAKLLREYLEVMV